MEFNFCRRCGAQLQNKGGGAYLCANGHHMYYTSDPATGVLLVNQKNEVLLAVRGIDPDKGMYDSPGGFCNGEENFEDAARRELQEELGLAPSDYGPLTLIANGVDMYLYEGELRPIQNMIYWARVTKKLSIHVADDVASAHWEPLADIDLNKFGKNFKAVCLAVERLREQLL
jgi:ADP-ribose pyrophosphatase YjhB (NUDIX family)